MSGASGKVTGNNAGDRIRERVGVEGLLVWAYSVQMVHHATREVSLGGRGGPKVASSSLWTEGSPVQSSRNQGFDADEDAWRVNDLVRELDPIMIDGGPDLAAFRYHGLAQYRGAEPPLGTERTADNSGRPWPTNGLLKIDVATMVVIHASRATRPEYPGMPKWRLKPVHKGMVRHPRSKGGAYRFGWYHHVEIDGLCPGEVVEQRVAYGAWWDALNTLRRKLQGNHLTMFSVTDAMPPPLRKV